MKILKFGTKNAQFALKFGLKFENIFVMFEIKVLEFVLLQSLVENKNPYWDQK